MPELWQNILDEKQLIEMNKNYISNNIENYIVF